MNAVNPAVAVAQPAIQAVPNGTDGKRYPIPDLTKFTFEKSSGYHYDSSTGLYYDSNSNYYWNSVIQKFLYYDQEKLTYLLAPISYEYTNTQQKGETTTKTAETKKLKSEKQGKVKVAKKIATVMKRLPKTLIQKKSAPLVAAYGGSESLEEETQRDETEFLDFTKLICNLCKRRLASAEALVKHAKFSALHKKNLEVIKADVKKGEGSKEKIVYRDRAKERRMKYEVTDEPQPSNLKKKYLKSREIADVPVASAFPQASQSSRYTLSDVDSLAEYSARNQANTVLEYKQYLEYYKNYFTQQITADNPITFYQDNQMNAVNAAAAVAQSAIQQMQAKNTFYGTTHKVVPNGIDGKRYPIPNPRKFKFEKNSGYHYDSSTGLYYDSNSNYYWNSVIQKFLYYDQEMLTYPLAPIYKYTNTQQVKTTTETAKSKKLKSEKKDKGKVAAKIAKDIERWAKTLNQKKKTSTSRLNIEGNSSSTGSAGSADVGYSVVVKENSSMSSMNITPTYKTLVAAYGESESSEEETQMDEMEITDFTKLICNSCKRHFRSAKALAKHAKWSDGHKKNLEASKAYVKKGEGSKGKIVCYDRAKEHRVKYGNTDEPEPSKLMENYLKSRELADVPVTSSVAEPIDSENVGNRLLQKMGWTEGQGLGKTNQGRTKNIQAKQRNSTVGLGNKAAYTAVAGERYRARIRKMTYARYQQLPDKM